MRRLFPQPEKEESYAQDKDYRGDRTRHINPPVQSSLTTKDQSVATQVENENASDDQLSSQPTEEDIYGSTKKSIFPDNFPISLNSIKEYVTEKDGSTSLWSDSMLLFSTCISCFLYVRHLCCNISVLLPYLSITKTFQNQCRFVYYYWLLNCFRFHASSFYCEGCSQLGDRNRCPGTE